MNQVLLFCSNHPWWPGILGAVWIVANFYIFIQYGKIFKGILSLIIMFAILGSLNWGSAHYTAPTRWIDHLPVAEKARAQAEIKKTGKPLSIKLFSRIQRNRPLHPAKILFFPYFTGA